MTGDTLAARVDMTRREATDILLLRLVERDGRKLPTFTPGSHIDVRLPSGLIRQYSLCNDPIDTDFYELAVKREPNSRGGSIAISELKAGDEVVIGLPRNNFPLAEDARLHVLLAGGIGLTPLLSMARQLNRTGEAFRLHYFAKALDHVAFRDLLAGPGFRESVDLHVGVEPDDMAARLEDLIGHRPDGAHLYLCGPRPFMDAVRTIAAKSWPSDTVHLEYFAADAQVLAAPRRSFIVSLAKSGGTFVVPEDKTIVEVLAENSIKIEVSCEQGVCGTCLTRVLEGVPDHRDTYLTDDEKRTCSNMTPCVSRSMSERLVLDL